MNPLPDIQKTPDTRGVRLDRVGVTGIRLPVKLRTRPSCVGGELTDALHTTAEFELSCSVPEAVKGTHMSRFTEVLHRYVFGRTFSAESLPALAKALQETLESPDVCVKMVADYFLIQFSPETSRFGLGPIKGELVYTIHNGTHCASTGIIIHGKTCCPCSREISGYDSKTGTGRGAHAQRGEATIRVVHAPGTLVWFEDLADIAWRSFSSPVYPVLKRPDEKHVTEHAYANPKFVEDVARDLTTQLRQLACDRNLHSMSIRVQNAESIHYHDAFAQVEEFFL